MLQNRIHKTIIITITLLFCLIFFTMSVSAATISYSGKFNGKNGAGQCAQQGFVATDYGPIQVNTTGNVTIVITNYSGATDVGVFFFDVNTPANVVGGFPAGVAYDTGTGTATVTLTTGVDYMLEICELAILPTGASYSVEITGDFVGNAVAASTTASTTTSNISYPPDERINWQYGDLYAILYRNLDSEGNWVIDTYCYDGSNSWLGMRTDSSSASGTSANGCDATFFIGSDGIYQFNINFDGKLYEIRCEDFACFEPEKLYYDPNE